LAIPTLNLSLLSLLYQYWIFAIMKASLLCSATLFSLATFAFPANLLSNDISDDTLADIAVLVAKIKRAAEERPDASNVKRGFNADAQRISTTGDHQYVRHLSRERSSSKC
jgi:hypothetical protein